VQTLDAMTITITAVNETDGLLVYQGLNDLQELEEVHELELDSFIQFTTPLDRLLSGQVDKPSALALRVETLEHLQRLDQSDVHGLLGARTSLLPHQIYIAREVSKRHAPRVLLADEVGLGKTIEAGMIIHQQLHTGQAQRVLILVPDSLVHQWFVEMLRRFNLHFSIFDLERFEAADSTVNPFDTEQLVLCPLSLLSDDPRISEAAIDAQWDLLVVDEAHHLEWSEEHPGEGYLCVESLAANSQGVLLLTATPEQVGIESHFARLRLLDPDRFYDINEFKAQEEKYQTLNTTVEKLLATEPAEILTNKPLQQCLQKFISKDQIDHIFQHEEKPREALVAQLLDRHGTSRVLFRNTRAAIPDFPGREAIAYPLAAPAQYQSLSGMQQLTPEHFGPADENWLTFDPRVAWLQDCLKKLRPHKVLVICAQADTAIALELHLRLKGGLRSAVFHEGIGLVERDRAAAYFAEEEEGAQVLICSEIGSEGRNFQFSHHLVLFDLPLNPDLLEQRIGRLDRIGQKETIHIHVPYLANTAQEVLFRWYHEGLNLLEQSCGTGLAIYDHFHEALAAQMSTADQQLDSLIEKTRDFTEATRERMQQGRDKLLEMNSCRMDEALEIIAQIRSAEKSEGLNEYMEKVFNHFGVDQEYHSPKAWVIRPGDYMHSHQFPGLPEDGLTFTFDRNTALKREDMTFLSWEHPMVAGAIELVLGPDFGNTNIATISVKGLPAGTLLIESIYTPSCMAPRLLQLQRFLPTTPLRVLIDIKGTDVSHVLSHEALNKLCEKIPRATAQAIVKQQHAEIRKISLLADELANRKLPELIEQAEERLTQLIGGEIERLSALQKINPHVRNEEIVHLQNLLAASEAHLENTQLELQTIRLVINR
jgi:ATP-dependent helicase HepA